MCYAKPGPRCSYHGRIFLQKSYQSYQKALSTQNTEKIITARADYDRAKWNFLTTPAGLRYLDEKITQAQVQDNTVEVRRVQNLKNSAVQTREEQTRMMWRVDGNGRSLEDLRDLIQRSDYDYDEEEYDDEYEEPDTEADLGAGTDINASHYSAQDTVLTTPEPSTVQEVQTRYANAYRSFESTELYGLAIRSCHDLGFDTDAMYNHFWAYGCENVAPLRSVNVADIKYTHQKEVFYGGVLNYITPGTVDLPPRSIDDVPYINNTAPVLVRLEDGSYWMLDGNHRVCAAKAKRLPTMTAHVINIEDLPTDSPSHAAVHEGRRAQDEVWRGSFTAAPKVS